MEGASESCLFTLNVCVACCVCFALRIIQRKGRVAQGASWKTLVRVYIFLVGRSINDLYDEVRVNNKIR